MNPQWIPAADGNYEHGRQQKISRITFHHIVGDADGALQRFRTPGVEVSATYVIGSDGRLYQCVAEADTPYTDGNYDSNSRAITIEHAGGIESVPYTDAMYATSIKLVSYLIKKYGITDFKLHRDVIDTVRYPGGTACPGELDVQRILKGATAQGDDMIKITQPIAELITLITTGWPKPDQDGGSFVKSLVGQELDEAGVEKLLNAMLDTPQHKELIAKVVTGDQEAAKKLAQIKELLGA